MFLYPRDPMSCKLSFPTIPRDIFGCNMEEKHWIQMKILGRSFLLLRSVNYKRLKCVCLCVCVCVCVCWEGGDVPSNVKEILI